MTLITNMSHILVLSNELFNTKEWWRKLKLEAIGD